MSIIVLKSKIHKATITECELDYEGSIEIDSDLMEAVSLYTYEKVLISNINNGNRFDTYVIPAPAGSGKIGLNGAAARLGQVGDQIIIFAFRNIEENETEGYKPNIVILNEHNKIKLVV